MNKKVKRRCKGFTLVELVIVIAIVIILSVVSVPIYRGYVDKSKMAEFYALCGTILSAQKAYYSEYGNFLSFMRSGNWTSFDPVLGIDGRSNKYFTWFQVGDSSDLKTGFHADVNIPHEFGIEKDMLILTYNITTGAKYVKKWW